jgi:NAD(P)-dependent dehydrogenase (short-subunit alcohol dehydrogenase family)
MAETEDPLRSEFLNRVALVTGAAKGIGLATARMLSRRGARVCIADIDSKAAEKACADIFEHGGSAVFFLCDVSQSRNAKKLAANVKDRFGTLDLLCHCAGIQHYGTVTTTTEEDWDRVLGINLKGIYLVSHELVPLMPQGSAIVNVASVQAFATQTGVAPYTASKGGILALTRSMALDLIPSGIRVNCVCPGTVNTPMLHWAIEQSPDPKAVLKECHRMHPIGRVAEPDEIAEVICFLLSPRASFMVGSIVLADGGLLLPIGGSKKE